MAATTHMSHERMQLVAMMKLVSAAPTISNHDPRKFVIDFLDDFAFYRTVSGVSEYYLFK